MKQKYIESDIVCNKETGSIINQWMVAIVANFTIFTYGTQTGWMSPMSKLLQSEDTPSGHPLSDTDISNIASAMCLSAALSTPAYAGAVDTYGRKRAVVCMVILQMICWIIKLSSTSTVGLIIARIICGLASGGCFNVIPIYTKEISQDHVRGYLGTLPILLQNMGLLFMYAVGSYLDYYTVLWIALCLPIINLLMLFKLPESPAYLVKIGKIEQASSVLAFLRSTKVDDKLILNEIEVLKTESSASQKTTTYLDICKNPIHRKGCLILLALLMVQAANGSFAILTYAASIMSASGVTFSPDLQTLSFPAVMILGSLFAMACVEKLGRRLLLIGGFLVSSVAFVALATCLLVQSRGSWTPPWLPVLTIIVTVYCYAGSITTVPYIVAAEMFSFHIRSKVTGVIVSCAWLTTFFTILVFPTLSNAVGLHYTFYGFAVVNLLGCIVSLVLLPETRGKTVEEIELDLR